VSSLNPVFVKIKTQVRTFDNGCWGDFAEPKTYRKYLAWWSHRLTANSAKSTQRKTGKQLTQMTENERIERAVDIV